MNIVTECLWKSVSQIWQILSTKWKLNGEIIASCIHKSLVTSTCFPKYIISSNNFDRKTNNNWINWILLATWWRKCNIEYYVLSRNIYNIIIYFIKHDRKYVIRYFRFKTTYWSSYCFFLCKNLTPNEMEWTHEIFYSQ